MRLLFKTLDNFTFHLDVEPSDKILDVKKRVVDRDPQRFLLDGMRLISAGNMLKDEMTLSDQNISDKSFVVVMCQKPKVVESPPPPAQPSLPPSSAAPEQVTDGSNEREEMIVRLTDMGFARSSVERALAASFYNPERAVEYLATGAIPEVEQVPSESSAVPSISLSIPADFNALDPETTLRALRSQPGFEALRHLVRSDPSMLSSLVAQIGRQNPGFLAFIESNPEGFLDILNSDEDEAAPAPTTTTTTTNTPSMLNLDLNERDVQAISRLKDLGYSEMACIQAYIACDKNEEAAANLLLEGDFDDAGAR